MSLYRLADVFRNLVLDDPQVRDLASAAKLDDRVQIMLSRMWYTPVCRYWPTTADQDLKRTAAGNSPVGTLDKNSRPTPEMAAALTAIADRYSAALAPLRSGLAIARGHLITGQSEVISAGIWSHPQFGIDFVNGDLGKFAEPTQSSVGLTFEALWSAVTIEGTSNFWSPRPVTQDIRKKSSAALRRVEKAVKAIWPDGDMAALSAKERNTQIKDWLRRNALSQVSDRTIQRYFSDRD